MFQHSFVLSGKTYYNVIIGDAQVDSFYMEYIIEAGTGTGYGRYDGRSDAPASASAYTGGSISNCANSSSDCLYNMVNPYDGNSAKSGTGTGNPTRVIMRMVLDDGITYSEFLKEAFDKKPLISQEIVEPGVISAKYALDMRSKTYSDSTPVSDAEITNQTFILEGTTAANQGDYDSTGAVITPTYFTDSTGVVVDGGAFTYTEGTGTGAFGGSNGTYTYYAADGFTENTGALQPSNRDYSVFCIASQNTDWSGNGACVNGNGGGGGRRGGGWGGW